MNWKGYAMKRPRGPGLCLEGMRSITKSSQYSGGPGLGSDLSAL